MPDKNLMDRATAHRKAGSKPREHQPSPRPETKVHSQDAGRPGTIINVLGDTDLSREQVVELAGLAIGAVITAADVAAARSRLFESGLFHDVSVDHYGSGIIITLTALIPGTNRIQPYHIRVVDLGRELEGFVKGSYERLLAFGRRELSKDPADRNFCRGNFWSEEDEYFHRILTNFVDGKRFQYLTDAVNYCRVIRLAKSEILTYYNILNFALNNHIDKPLESEAAVPTLEERDRFLAYYAERASGEQVVQLVHHLYPEIRRTVGTGTPNTRAVDMGAPPEPLPQTAPELWKGGRGKTTDPDGNPEQIVPFITRVYGRWMSKGLTRSHLRHLDSDAVKALENYEFQARKSSKAPDYPPGWDLPSNRVTAERERRDFEQRGTEALSGLSGNDAIRKLDRVRKAEWRANRREQGSKR